MADTDDRFAGLEAQITTPRLILAKWLVRVGILVAIAWGYQTATGGAPAWLWPAVGAYAVLSLGLSFLLRALHKRTLDTGRARVKDVAKAFGKEGT